MKINVFLRTHRELLDFNRAFGQLSQTVREADGKYRVHIEARTPDAMASCIVSKEAFDRVVSAEMLKDPAAFSKRVAGGRFLPDRLNRTYAALTRETLKQREAARGQRKVLTKREYIAFYHPDAYLALYGKR